MYVCLSAGGRLRNADLAGTLDTRLSFSMYCLFSNFHLGLGIDDIATSYCYSQENSTPQEMTTGTESLTM